MSMAAELARIVNARAGKPNAGDATVYTQTDCPQGKRIAMSPLALGLAAVALVVVLLIAYGVSQAMAAQREERLLLINGLLSRADHFEQLLTALPAGFLPVELRQLVAGNLLETWKQLRTLDPGNSKFRQAEQDCRQQLEQVTAAGDGNKRTPLDNPAIIREVRGHLKKLAEFLQQQIESGRLNAQQAKTCTGQMHQMQIQLTLDSYNITIKQANTSCQYSLAAHNCEMAKKLLLKENNPRMQQLIAHYQQLAEQFLLKAEQASNPAAATSSAAAPTAAPEENQPATTRKSIRPEHGLKKNLYD